MTEPASWEALPLAFSDPREAGTPVIFVHGFAHNRFVWEKLARDLPAHLRPIAVDLRGHGESPWAIDGSYHPASYAADLSGVLDALELDRAVVVGHSLGGVVSLLMAAGQPDRVAGLVLVDSGPSLESSGVEHVTEEVAATLRSYASIEEFRDQLALTHPLGDPEVLGRLASTAVVRRVDGRYEPALDPGVLGDSELSAETATLERDLWSALAAVQCPVLVVRGGVSAILSEKIAREMVDEVLADGSLVTLPSAGHSCMIDDGPGLATAIADFVVQPTAPGATVSDGPTR